MTVVRKIAGLQWPLLLLVILLGAFGIFAIYSATWMREQDFWHRQLVFLIVGLVLCVGVAMTDYHWARAGAVPLYIAGLLGLVAVHFFGATVFGAKSWLDFGFINFASCEGGHGQAVASVDLDFFDVVVAEQRADCS